MAEMIVTTYDWVPDLPRGFVRDLRVRWALEEAGLPYRVESTPFRDRGPDHFAHQPFGQIPWLTDGDRTIFESGAILLHIGERSTNLLPTDPKARSETIEWVFAALNSIEMATQPWALMRFWDIPGDNIVRERFDGWVPMRLAQMDALLAGREWLVGDFSIADILMADVLRLVDRFDGLAEYPACKAYVTRATERPAFIKAHADQMAHFAAGD
ncbi:glutathione S-transferase family protein [Sphingomonas sp. LB-2]|uniref:glutathione S-transferase family protein n=1 Tax=Sphingomonas caeni TaxID=2984949 RepID=UPI002230D7AD|nr:glutathione S-transferase family protein [Sphingomonas caeni]MCW3849579.1 glutathione S-transferase family protein [Sphingomonas caeni]